MKHQKEYAKSLAITAVLDTGIALVLHQMVLEDATFLEVLVVSQLTGLSICSFVHLGLFISDRAPRGARKIAGGAR